MDAPPFLDNLQTLKEFNPSEHQMRILERIVGVVPHSSLQALEYSYNQANALTLNPHIKAYQNGNFQKQIESWRTALFAQLNAEKIEAVAALEHAAKIAKERVSRAAHSALYTPAIFEQMETILELKEQEKKSSSFCAQLVSAQNQSDAKVEEIRQANAALMARLQILEQARKQDADRVQTLEQKIANQKWWNKALLFCGVGATATILYVVHQKANAQPKYTPSPIASNQATEEKKPTPSGTPATPANITPAAIALPPTPTTDSNSIWTRLNNTINYISQSLTGTQTEVAQIKTDVADLKKRLGAHVETSNINVDAWSKWIALFNENSENQRKAIELLNKRPFVTNDDSGRLFQNANNGDHTKIHGAWIDKDWAKKHQSK